MVHNIAELEGEEPVHQGNQRDRADSRAEHVQFPRVQRVQDRLQEVGVELILGLAKVRESLLRDDCGQGRQRAGCAGDHPPFRRGAR
jgi:hypothetical protein